MRPEGSGVRLDRTGEGQRPARWSILLAVRRRWNVLAIGLSASERSAGFPATTRYCVGCRMYEDVSFVRRQDVVCSVVSSHE